MMELGYCVDHGIPHSEWLEWDAEDRSKVIAYLVEQAERCDMCGTAPWEWEENPFAYEPVDSFCKGCYQKSVYSDSESTSLPGTNVQLIPVTEARKMERLIAEEKRKARRKTKEDARERSPIGAAS
jgi:hypothetical protein